MSRYIDADLMREKAYQMNFAGRINERELFLFNRALSEMPTVDAVPVWKIKNRMKYLLNAEAIKPHDYNFVWNVIIHGTLDEIKEWGAGGERRSDD